MVPAGASYCRVENFNQSDNNSVITNYYQHGPTDIYSFTLNELLVVSISYNHHLYSKSYSYAEGHLF